MLLLEVSFCSRQLAIPYRLVFGWLFTYGTVAVFSMADSFQFPMGNSTKQCFAKQQYFFFQIPLHYSTIKLLQPLFKTLTAVEVSQKKDITDRHFILTFQQVRRHAGSMGFVCDNEVLSWSKDDFSFSYAVRFLIILFYVFLCSFFS